MTKGGQHAVLDMFGLADKTEIGAVARQLAARIRPHPLPLGRSRSRDGVDRGDELLIDGPGEYHLDDFHRSASVTAAHRRSAFAAEPFASDDLAARRHARRSR